MIVPVAGQAFCRRYWPDLLLVRVGDEVVETDRGAAVVAQRYEVPGADLWIVEACADRWVVDGWPVQDGDLSDLSHVEIVEGALTPDIAAQVAFEHGLLRQATETVPVRDIVAVAPHPHYRLEELWAATQLARGGFPATPQGWAATNGGPR